MTFNPELIELHPTLKADICEQPCSLHKEGTTYQQCLQDEKAPLQPGHHSTVRFIFWNN